MERQSFILLGVEIGTGSGWDYADHSVWWIYDFEPVSGISLPKCGLLNIDMHEGLFEACAADGSIESSTSIIETFSSPDFSFTSTVNFNDGSEQYLDNPPQSIDAYLRGLSADVSSVVLTISLPER